MIKSLRQIFILGRPKRLALESFFFAINRRCQANTFCGVTIGIHGIRACSPRPNSSRRKVNLLDVQVPHLQRIAQINRLLTHYGLAGFPFPVPFQITLSPDHDLVLHVNNTRPVVNIDSISYDGALLDECAIIRLPNDTATLDFVYTANHPDGFLDNYAMVALVGRNRNAGTVVSDNYSNHGAADGVWLGETLTPLPVTPLSTLQPGLQPWESCAYQFRLTAWARTTNGFGRIYHTTFFHNSAIDLNAGGPCSPDLDGDGDVDGDDLAIFAAAFGSSL